MKHLLLCTLLFPATLKAMKCLTYDDSLKRIEIIACQNEIVDKIITKINDSKDREPYIRDNEIYYLEKELKTQHQSKLASRIKDSIRPHESCISLWEQQFIVTSPTIKKPLLLSTTYLGENITTVLYIKYIAGEQYSGITHYPATILSCQLDEAQKLCLEALDKKNQYHEITNIKFFLAIPSIHTYITNARYKQLIEIVKTTLYPYPLKIQILTYDAKECESRYLRDVEVILSAHKASLRIRNKEIDLFNNYQ
jgi:hypothetical protein